MRNFSKTQAQLSILSLHLAQPIKIVLDRTYLSLVAASAPAQFDNDCYIPWLTIPTEGNNITILPWYYSHPYYITLYYAGVFSPT